MTGRPAILLLGPGGLATGRRIAALLPDAELCLPTSHQALLPAATAFAEVGPQLQQLFRAGRPIIGLCASGILIRLLAPLLADKRAEPPVLAVAEDGSAVVPLLGGHHGANRLAQTVAAALGGQAAITTAGELRLGVALDAPPPGWVLANPDDAKPFMAALLAGAPVEIQLEAGPTPWLAEGRWPSASASGAAHRILVTERPVAGDARCLVFHPQRLALGVGCERDTDPAELSTLAQDVLAAAGVSPRAVACVVSLDLKAAEPAVHALAAALGVPARFCPAERLAAEEHRLATPSALVFQATGCHGVAEGAALAAVGPAGALVVAKQKSARATCALARALAPLEPDRIGQGRGQLALVGLGPGLADWRSPEAEHWLAAADDWVGYGGYLDLVAALARPGQSQHRFALGEEEARVRQALTLAAAGRRVALVCSGDPGIYAMASLTFELIEAAAVPAWQLIELVVCPGISALQAAAARAGAPLGHDFCAISLSDLMTPWPVIEQRLQAAAAGDFVTALYNPASLRRRQGLTRALAILRAARPGGTPVILARNLGRPGEQVTLHRLDDFDERAVDMLSLVMVGAAQTRLLEGRHGQRWVYTPRGYQTAQAASA